MAATALLDLLDRQVLLGDGALGTLLHQRGFPLDACYDALNLDQPDIVQQVHLEYLQAGARLIETNTFGANRLKLEKFERAAQLTEINRRGAELAVAAAHPAGALAAGSVGPLTSNPSILLNSGQCEQLYREQCEALLAGGVDALLLETFPRLEDLLTAVRAARSLGATPIIASLSFGDDGHTADGFRINESFRRLREAGAAVTGLNCHFGPTLAERLLQELEVQAGERISVFPNAGRPEYFEGRYIYHPTPQYFADFLPRLVAQGARLIGGCCGTTPETIAAMARALPGVRPVESKPAQRPVPELGGAAKVTTTAPGLEPRPEKATGLPPANLLDVLHQRVLIVTELDPPKSLPLDKLLAGAAALRSAGTDFVTLADNSLAILRVSNLAAGFLVKERTGLEPIIHLACRDKNLLGLQSELMGLHALGIHHVLALTGDPAKIGDHPAASSVYDVNSIGLIRTIAQINQGVAANGRDLKARGQFIIGCAFNPNARNLDSQVRKLEDKAKAGAHFVMTQPIFDPNLARLTWEKTKSVGLPVLMGVMPLLNARNTEFLHNEVPGIQIPETVRARMHGQDGAAGPAAGLAIAREICDSILEYFQGIYLITPLLRYDLTVSLSQYVRGQAKRRP
ncbi:MAG TPA: bifunctional homocysteine S-methyltransferase/methylenetetrahydrofolate reductase [Verrucomicrobiae bacterium]|nr:bifunctional homocysteine S-methyltransferase/methylenetetrahydrofolate reductase [Verrucomicrobiae bacterium]